MGRNSKANAELIELQARVSTLQTKIDQMGVEEPNVKGLKRQSQRDIAIALLLAILAIAAVVVAFWLLAANLDAAEDVSVNILYWALAAVTAVAIGTLVLSDRYRRSSRSAGMRAYEFSVLSNYEQQLTPFQVQVLRLTLAPRLFAGTSDQVDIATDPEWSSTAELISLLNGEDSR